jgi:hypothetical protein
MGQNTIDQKIVWYGSINLLSYGSAQESIMRLNSSNIAQELIKTLEIDQLLTNKTDDCMEII